MPKIAEEHPYNGATERIARLGLTPLLEELRGHVRAARADDLPILLVAIEHDGAGPALAKQAKRPRKKP